MALIRVGAGYAGHRYLTWTTIVLCGVDTAVGVCGIGSYFLLPTLFLLVAASALSVDVVT